MEIKELIGKILVDVINVDNNELIFICDNGDKYKLYHQRDCCEHVEIEDICGDLKDLIGNPVLIAEENSTDINPDGVEIPEWQESFTWTFYKLATIKGYVDVRWYGESNGYYSEEVDFIKADKNDSW